MKPIQLFCLASLVGTGSLLPAATLGYYRFEDGAFLDNSEGAGSSLTVGGTPAQVELTDPPDRGSAFPKTIPQTGATNEYTASIFGEDRFGEVTNGSLQVTSDFTTEAFINMATTTSGTQYIASDWEYGIDERGFALGVAGSSGVSGGSAGALFVLLSDAGNDSIVYQTGITIAEDVDYYVGVSFDESDTTNGITFYAQDLTNNGALLSASLGHTVSSLHDASALFRIGSMNGNTSPFQGFIDEVRVSDTVLSESELLVIPEPSTWALITGAFGLLYLLRHRRS